MVGIRADANETIATGHVMRCITIAKQLKKRGEEVLFFVADAYACHMLEQAKMEYVCLHTVWNHMEEELPVLCRALEKAGCKKLLVDSYEATAAYLATLRRQVSLIYMDDMFEAVYPVDLLINYNAYCQQFPYGQAYDVERGGTALLLGTSYVPLRPEFSGDFLKKEEAAYRGQGPFHVLVSCGGGDTYNALFGILEKALQRKALGETVFHTVVGSFHRNAGRLEKLFQGQPRIVLHHNVNNMAELMGKCDAAVSAAGTVLYELCAMRVPAVFFVCADNQEHDSDFFAAEERMLFAGDIRTDREGCLERICTALERLEAEEDLRKRMKEKLGAVTDGRGAARIAEEIMRLPAGSPENHTRK